MGMLSLRDGIGVRTAASNVSANEMMGRRERVNWDRRSGERETLLLSDRKRLTANRKDRRDNTRGGFGDDCISLPDGMVLAALLMRACATRASRNSEQMTV